MVAVVAVDPLLVLAVRISSNLISSSVYNPSPAEDRGRGSPRPLPQGFPRCNRNPCHWTRLVELHYNDEQIRDTSRQKFSRKIPNVMEATSRQNQAPLSPMISVRTILYTKALRLPVSPEPRPMRLERSRKIFSPPRNAIGRFASSTQSTVSQPLAIGQWRLGALKNSWTMQQNYGVSVRKAQRFYFGAFVCLCLSKQEERAMRSRATDYFMDDWSSFDKLYQNM